MKVKAKKPKSRTVTAKVIGAIPHVMYNGVGWKVRMAAPYLPFYLDSSTAFTEKATADAFAEKLKMKKVQITITG